ncbi:MAG: hypothetical protein WC551_10955 [Patescibacteria group bacterium]
MALPSIGGGRQIGDGNINEIALITQAAPQTATDTATLTAAQITGGIIVGTPTGAATYTFPTVALLEAALVNAKVDSAFDLHIINVATTAAYDITVAVGTGWTFVGQLEVSSNDAITSQAQGHFRARKTGSGTWTLYRLA